jgi:hypothetical protein
MPKPLMQSVLGPLLKERQRLEAQLRAVTAALAAFRKSRVRKRTISTGGRKRIAAAQRARWAKFRAAKKK